MEGGEPHLLCLVLLDRLAHHKLGNHHRNLRMMQLCGQLDWEEELRFCIRASVPLVVL